MGKVLLSLNIGGGLTRGEYQAYFNIPPTPAQTALPLPDLLIFHPLRSGPDSVVCPDSFVGPDCVNNSWQGRRQGASEVPRPGFGRRTRETPGVDGPTSIRRLEPTSRFHNEATKKYLNLITKRWLQREGKRRLVWLASNTQLNFELFQRKDKEHSRYFFSVRAVYDIFCYSL